jgi:hypothetical protein
MARSHFVQSVRHTEPPDISPPTMFYSIANGANLSIGSKQMLVRSRLILITDFVSGDKNVHGTLDLG